MATQCRSSKCTAERKGFRRELDSWRHKLVHCVGFESILEGIYGPRLLRDLSIFDDCEPDAVSDWSVDASCSFCNLQLEKLSDHIPTVSSPQSTPTEETPPPPPQGQSNTENIECQADRFLHAIFRKKDLPQSCDPNIPLVAQELMRKMIHQFAIEYASKSQIEGAKNGASEDVGSVCSGLQNPSDQDSPLDLTVNRSQPNVEQADGVLDLSKKNCASSAMSTASNQKASGSLGLAGDIEVHLDTREEKFEARSSTLETVLSSLCPYHKTLLYQILKCMCEYYGISTHQFRNAHRHFPQTDSSLYCHLSKKLNQDMYSFGDYKTSNACYLQACRVNAYHVSPVCICMKNLHCLSCQTVAIGCISNVVGPSSCGCYPHHQRCPCSCQNYIDGAYITPVGNVANSPFTPHKACDSFNPCTRGCSPSPPPLSPKPPDAIGKITDKTIVCSFSDGKTCSNQPPSLLPYEEESDELFNREGVGKEDDETTRQKVDEEGTKCSIEPRKCLEQRPSGTSIQDLVERISENLNKTEPLEKGQNFSTTANESLQCIDEACVGKITTTVVCNENDHDYTLKELPYDPKAPEDTPIQTNSVTQENTVNKSLDIPSSCTQSLQSETDLADQKRLNQDVGIEVNTQSSSLQLISDISDVEGVPEDVDSGITKDCCDNQNAEQPLCTPENKGNSQTVVEKDTNTEGRAISMKGISHESGGLSPEKQIWPSQSSNCSDSGRSRRNIVPPQRFSSYVTEPRKMYFAACFSESIFIRKASKDKLLKDADSENSSDIKNESSIEPVAQKESSSDACNITQATDDDEQVSNKPKERDQATTEPSSPSVQEKERKDVEGSKAKWTSPRKKKLPMEAPRNHMKSKPSGAQRKDYDSQLQKDDSKDQPLANTQAIDNAPVSSECHSVPQYTSPIRLMYVSPMVCENGIRYTLKSAVCGSADQGETFDPCEESSWGGTTKAAVKETSPSLPCTSRTEESSLLKWPVTTDEVSRTNPLSDMHGKERDTCPAVPEMTTSPLKRRPGRPKKLGPQIEKRAKRPIGRPPKHRDESSKSDGSKANTNSMNSNSTAISCEDKDEKANKNLKITVVYGRSRRIKRLVSEENGNLRKDQQTEHQEDFGQKCDLNGNVIGPSLIGSSEKPPEGQTENFNFVGPIKSDRKCVPPPSSKLKCQKQKRSVSVRKPGRPPKVKISGISVTVTTVSPKQRKIRMNSDITESGREESQHASSAASDNKPPKEQMTITSDANHKEEMENVEDGEMSKKTPVVPLRHSARERKPSIHLLHSVATSRAFSHSNALLRRSRKLLLNKASSEPSQIKSTEKPLSEGLVISDKASRHGQDLNVLSGISADSIFTSNESLKWWPTSASSESLNEELSRRIEMMSETWIAGAIESSKSCSVEKEIDLGERACSTVTDFPKSSVSAVQMLFRKHCNMGDLCAWFMQTTETQSLAIVRKASARNPYEIIQYNPNRATKRIVCPSPQAERLRKHVKKFAKIVPKSPAMHLQAQERMSRTRRLNVRRRLFLKRSRTIPRTVHKRHLWSRAKPLGSYRSTLLRAKLKFMTKRRMPKGKKRQYGSLTLLLGRESSRPLRKNALTPESLLQVDNKQLSVDTGYGSLNSSVPGERESMTQQAQNTKAKALGGDQEERVRSKTWSPETLRECRVFLKKINSPETKSAVEECNFCTVKLRNVSSEYGLPGTTENGEEEKAEGVKPGGRRRSTRKMSSPYPEDLWVHTIKKRGKRKSHATNGSQTAKRARQSEWKIDRKGIA